MVLTMAAVAENKGMHVTRLAASVEGRTDFGRETSTCFTSHLEVGQGLSQREVRILHNAARLCEVHKMLRGEITFEERLEAVKV